MANLTVTRRQNALTLFQAHAERSLAAGASPKGLEQEFAASMEISPSMWSQIKSSRPISDKLARQIEAHAEKSAGWLDEPRETGTPSEAERNFVELAQQAWRMTNASGRRRLRKLLLDFAGTENQNRTT